MNKVYDKVSSIISDIQQGVIQFDSEIAVRFLELTELFLRSENRTNADTKFYHNWLLVSGRTQYLSKLADSELLNRWAECAFKFIQLSDFSFNDLLRYRAEKHPQKILFVDMAHELPSRYSYTQIWQRTKETAAAIYKLSAASPRMAILCENSPESAIIDIACIAWDIPVSPISVHFTQEELLGIFSSMKFNIAVTDSIERIQKLEEISQALGENIVILHINETIQDIAKQQYLPKLSKTLSKEEIDTLLSKRNKLSINQVCTTMFTSGSTGRPKGVSFSNYNLVSKRFARAAALPDVGEDEVLLCFLPLFHTFGRYLEMMGMIFWSGTYVFVGNSSADNLLALFPKINPTGFISVPVRWVQLYEKIMEDIEHLTSAKDISDAIRNVVGSNLRWGLSAAGYLDPKIFQFFHRHQIELCSGFGMTEATGGITMTPPAGYIEGTVGKPLPGVKTKFADSGEMLISGHYIAHYLDNKTFGDIIDFPKDSEQDFWMPTGDVFKVNDSGYYEIVDRVKDIYKNSKGQTVSPKNVEIKFEGVPGIKRVFLAGDGKAYNTLLIVPDFDDSLFEEDYLKDDPRQYFQKIISEANLSLAPYERVVNFTLLERDFDLQHEELTPKGSFNRKTIERNFEQQIAKMYEKASTEIKFDDFRVVIPRWFYRDISILEDEIIKHENGIINKENSLYLHISRIGEGKYQIGDFIYHIDGNTIDLGTFALQPKLWLGNAQFVSFAPCKANWDHNFSKVSPNVQRDFSQDVAYSEEQFANIKGLKNNKLIEANRLTCDILYLDDDKALQALQSLANKYQQFGENLSETVRFRIQSLAYHPNEEIRCLAYRTILQDESISETSKLFPTFLESGLSFLNSKSIEIIAQGNFGRRRLIALRKRLLSYRKQLSWPQTPTLHKQIESVFRLLVDFVKHHPEYYSPVRVELSNWVLHKQDTALSEIAEKYFWILSKQYEASLEQDSIAVFPANWLHKITFEDTLSCREVENIKKVIIGTTFLKQSIVLAFDEYGFNMEDIKDNGIWVSKVSSISSSHVFRLSINTKQGKHYDLRLVLNDNLSDSQNIDTILWLIAVAGYPEGPNVLPSLGCARPELQARTMEFIGDMTVWERLRQISSNKMLGQSLPKLSVIKRIFTEGIAAFFRAWENSEYNILPGAINPSNVVVSDINFRDGATILSLAGWRKFEGCISLIEPIICNFYRKAIHHYAWIKDYININWVFDAAMEAIGESGATAFFDKLLIELESNPIEYEGAQLIDLLKAYIESIKVDYYQPLPLINAIDKYHEWQNINPNAIPAAKEQSITELFNLYRLGRYSEIARYHLYRYTYFADKEEHILAAFDNLLKAMNKDKSVPATQLIELSELQGVLGDATDREFFSKMVFPGYKKTQHYDLQKFNENQENILIIRTTFKDNFGDIYIFREPAEPAEIGLLYRLFYKEKFSKTISEQDQFLILFDSNDRIVGGITYQIKDDHTCVLDGVVLASQFRGRGLGRAMLEDFINRVQSIGVEIIKTTFFVDSFYSKLGFSVDKRWGLLVKILNKGKYLEG